MTPSRPAPSNRSNQSRARTTSPRHGRHVHPGDARSHVRGQRLAAVRERAGAEVLAVQREQIPGHEARRGLGGEQADARIGRMDPEQERIEVEAAGSGDHHLAVDHDPGRQGGHQGRHELGEVALQRPQVAALQDQLVAVPEDEAAEAVPLRLVCPPIAVRQRCLRRGEHRLQGRVEGQAHAGIMGRAGPGDAGRPRGRGRAPERPGAGAVVTARWRGAAAQAGS